MGLLFIFLIIYYCVLVPEKGGYANLYIDATREEARILLLLPVERGGINIRFVRAFINRLYILMQNFTPIV